MEISEIEVKAAFIKEAFAAAGLIVRDIPDEHMREVTVFRRSDKNDSAFILLTVGYDVRDPEWYIDLSVGNGHPENADDQVEFQIATISLVELGELDKSSHYLGYDIEEKELVELFASGVECCKGFIDGKIADAIAARNLRNLKKCVDPLGLESCNAQMADQLKSRNEELKSIYRKYL